MVPKYLLFFLILVHFFVKEFKKCAIKKIEKNFEIFKFKFFIEKYLTFLLILKLKFFLTFSDQKKSF